MADTVVFVLSPDSVASDICVLDQIFYYEPSGHSHDNLKDPAFCRAGLCPVARLGCRMKGGTPFQESSGSFYYGLPHVNA